MNTEHTQAPAVAGPVELPVGRQVPERCGIMHDRGEPFVIDSKGCLLAEGHEGPHEFADQRGQHWLWETDIECGCEYCMRCEGDYCTTYWRKPPNGAGNRLAEGESG